MKFSSRVPADVTPNRLAQALGEVKQSGRAILDLTLSNPTRAGFHYPSNLLAPLADPRGLAYAPDPLGLAAAREAVADDFTRRGLSVEAARLALTASTSEAYSLIFKLLCSPGDEVLVPRPSYPLFEHLTRLDGVTAVPYDLEYDRRWTMDRASVESAITAATRAVLVVSPNNPTGNFITADELDFLSAACAPRGVAIISDEVFADYALSSERGTRSGRLLHRTDVLGFTLGGMSKSIGLPQVKLGWIALSGDAAVVRDARERLEIVCDTYLSVSTPLQAAARELLERGAVVREQIHERVRANFRAFRDAVGGAPACEALHADGGWYGVLRVPATIAEEDLVLSLLEDDDVLVHPGYFFDFPREAFLVVSLLCEPMVFCDGLSRILRRFRPASSLT